LTVATSFAAQYFSGAQRRSEAEYEYYRDLSHDILPLLGRWISVSGRLQGLGLVEADVVRRIDASASDVSPTEAKEEALTMVVNSLAEFVKEYQKYISNGALLLLPERINVPIRRLIWLAGPIMETLQNEQQGRPIDLKGLDRLVSQATAAVESARDELGRGIGLKRGPWRRSHFLWVRRLIGQILGQSPGQHPKP
jgi:hypothetical protein